MPSSLPAALSRQLILQARKVVCPADLAHVLHLQASWRSSSSVHSAQAVASSGAPAACSSLHSSAQHLLLQRHWGKPNRKTPSEGTWWPHSEPILFPHHPYAQ